MLKERGVDAIISFRTMLLDIIDRVEINRNYRKSDTLSCCAFSRPTIF